MALSVVQKPPGKTYSDEPGVRGAGAHCSSGSKAADLVAAVAIIADKLRGHAAESDSLGRLAPESVDALRASELWAMRLCRELGGLELPIVEQMKVIAALAAEDTSAAWCTMIANDAVAMLGATMPDAAIARVFADGIPACSIVAPPGGSATPVEGGYTLNGHWRLASGIHQADWVHATVLVERDPSRLLPLAIPANDVTVVESWNVMGLAGTGSNDFTLTDYFLPAALAGREDHPYQQVRGTRRYDLVDVEHLESYEHLAFAIGVARRALTELQAMLAKPPLGRHVADREVVQDQFGRAVMRLHAVEALAYSLYARIDAAMAGEPRSWSEGDRHLPRVLAAQGTELALECVQLAFRRSGLAGLQRPNILEKLLRDMSVAATHVVVDDSAFSSYAQHLVELGGTLNFSGADRPR